MKHRPRRNQATTTNFFDISRHLSFASDATAYAMSAATNKPSSSGPRYLFQPTLETPARTSVITGTGLRCFPGVEAAHRMCPVLFPSVLFRHGHCRPLLSAMETKPPRHCSLGPLLPHMEDRSEYHERSTKDQLGNTEEGRQRPFAGHK